MCGIGIAVACFYYCSRKNCNATTLYEGQYFKGYVYLLHSNLTSNTGIVAQIDSNYIRKASLIYDGTGFNCDSAQIEDIVYFKIRKYKNNGPIMAYDLTYVEPTNVSTSNIADNILGNFNLVRRINVHLVPGNHCETVPADESAHTRYHYEGIAPIPNTKQFMNKTYTKQIWKDLQERPFNFYSLETVVPGSLWYLDFRIEPTNELRILSLSLNDTH